MLAWDQSGELAGCPSVHLMPRDGQSLAKQEPGIRFSVSVQALMESQCAVAVALTCSSCTYEMTAISDPASYSCNGRNNRNTRKWQQEHAHFDSQIIHYSGWSQASVRACKTRQLGSFTSPESALSARFALQHYELAEVELKESILMCLDVKVSVMMHSHQRYSMCYLDDIIIQSIVKVNDTIRKGRTSDGVPGVTAHYRALKRFMKQLSAMPAFVGKQSRVPKSGGLSSAAQCKDRCTPALEVQCPNRWLAAAPPYHYGHSWQLLPFRILALLHILGNWCPSLLATGAILDQLQFWANSWVRVHSFALR
eukprot:1426348-Amphidinium_carterae.1